MDDHVLDPVRDPVLRPSGRLAAPALAPHHATSIDAAETALRHQLRQYGLGLVRFEQALDPADFVDLGRRLGELMVENDPAVQPFVEDGVVLHLRQETLSGRVEHAPFEPRELLLHTEGSRRPAGRQPRFIALYCVDPGDDPGSQTVLVPFSAVLGRLADQTLAVLRETREARVDGTPTILVPWQETERFSFRDLGDEAYLWESPFPQERTERALLDLLTACYDSGQSYGSHWSERDLMVIDNTRWFHGRTWSRAPGGAAARPRHLMRLRIQDPRP
ncbi:TauD/TfdA family dioxygenase [Solwaraspora sp. WMMD1047]|uniref:TauD/TfdA family dioxygenase n=1 Tax=Solwaraspora sp. WMMD1047 TaxID=3016102 RepID=UPI002416BB5E|nr:TauD/TfdA family dioxygenase [Solwaraspora sp. WMMD1047]MDG4829591.1 TauD/TfdA family dioxygenase [Solwaraspora sp. WMMD1047]